MNRFHGFTEKISKRLSQILSTPQVKQQAKESIKKSIIDELRKIKETRNQRELEKTKTITKKKQKGIEIGEK